MLTTTSQTVTRRTIIPKTNEYLQRKYVDLKLILEPRIRISDGRATKMTDPHDQLGSKTSSPSYIQQPKMTDELEI